MKNKRETANFLEEEPYVSPRGSTATQSARPSTRITYFYNPNPNPNFVSRRRRIAAYGCAQQSAPRGIAIANDIRSPKLHPSHLDVNICLYLAGRRPNTAPDAGSASLNPAVPTTHVRPFRAERAASHLGENTFVHVKNSGRRKNVQKTWGGWVVVFDDVDTFPSFPLLLLSIFTAFLSLSLSLSLSLPLSLSLSLSLSVSLTLSLSVSLYLATSFVLFVFLCGHGVMARQEGRDHLLRGEGKAVRLLRSKGHGVSVSGRHFLSMHTRRRSERRT